jgi:hypothetical protein
VASMSAPAAQPSEGLSSSSFPHTEPPTDV